MMELPHSISEDLIIVKIDGAITVKNDGGSPETFIIEDGVDVIKSVGEINRTEPPAQALIGANARAAFDFFYMLYLEQRILPANFYTSGRIILVMHCIDILKIRFQLFTSLEKLLLDLAERKFRFLPMHLDDLRNIISMSFK